MYQLLSGPPAHVFAHIAHVLLVDLVDVSRDRLLATCGVEGQRAVQFAPVVVNMRRRYLARAFKLVWSKQDSVRLIPLISTFSDSNTQFRKTLISPPLSVCTFLLFV